jgi:hypothetical protein
MKRVMAIFLFFHFACSEKKNAAFELHDSSADRTITSTLDSLQNISNQSKFDHSNSNGLFKDVQCHEIKALNSFQKAFLDNLVRNGEGEFETDSTYFIHFSRNYFFESRDTIFYILGQFVPSNTKFHFYGGYNTKNKYCEIYHLPIETSFSFTRYEIDNNQIRVYGEMEDNNSEDQGEILLFELNHY